MEINVEKQEKTLKCSISGRIDTVSTVEIQKHIELSDVNEAIFDLAQVDYLSSAGLRFFIFCYKTLKEKSGILRIINIHDDVRSAFEIVGLTKILEVS